MTEKKLQENNFKIKYNGSNKKICVGRIFQKAHQKPAWPKRKLKIYLK